MRKVLSAIKALVLREPVLTQGAIQSLLGLGLAFGWELSDGQMGALLTVSASVLALVTRQTVTPTASIAARDKGSR